VKMGNLLPV